MRTLSFPTLCKIPTTITSSPGEQFVEQSDKLLGSALVGEGGEAADVGKEDAGERTLQLTY